MLSLLLCFALLFHGSAGLADTENPASLKERGVFQVNHKICKFLLSLYVILFFCFVLLFHGSAGLADTENPASLKERGVFQVNHKIR